MRLRTVTLLVTLSMLAPWSGQAQNGRPAARGDIALPPISWTCPMHPEIVEDRSGACPICRMALVPVRLELDWSCPVHTAVIEPAGGRCPICRRTLVQVTAALSWTCPDHPDVNESAPGRHAADGRELVLRRERRPHGDHNPRHGGLFFMASDNTHHLEGTYPQPGVFRIFLYDEYTRAIPPGSVTGRAVTREVFDAAAHTSRDVEAFALRPSADGKSLEARLPSTSFPIDVTAKLRFDPNGPEQRFDFSFRALTKEPAPGTGTASMQPVPATQPIPAAPSPSATTAALLSDLGTQADRVAALFQQGAYADMYFPALATKEAALALGDRTNQLAPGRRDAAADAVRRIVLGAWLVDLYGDIGDKPKLGAAYRSFSAAVSDLKGAYAR